MIWTDARSEILRTLWAQGLSGSAIAAEIGGCSRNSIIGRVHRMGLPKRQRLNQPRTEPKPRIHRVQRFREALPQHDRHYVDWLNYRVAASYDRSPPLARSCTLMDLTSDTCRWPLWGDVVSDQYCGAKLLSGSPYCRHHARMAWRRSGQ
jgi:GcrA cell cycle regulator